jgi:peroxiredoxin Q/BCP
VILYFYPRDDTSGCTKEACGFRDLKRQWAKHDTVVLGCSPDGEKMMYGKKTQGVIRSTVWIGPDGKVKKHWARVAKAADHPATVLEAIEADG